MMGFSKLNVGSCSKNQSRYVGGHWPRLEALSHLTLQYINVDMDFYIKKRSKKKEHSVTDTLSYMDVYKVFTDLHGRFCLLVQTYILNKIQQSYREAESL